MANYTPLDARGKLANRIKKILTRKQKAKVVRTRVKYNSKLQSDRIKQYQFPTQLNLYAAMDYMRNSGTRLNKRIHSNALYNAKGVFIPHIYIPAIRGLLSHLRRQRRLEAKSRKSRVKRRIKITSKNNPVDKFVYNLNSSLNAQTVKINNN